MLQIVYVSSAAVPFGKEDLLELLAKSRANNAKLDVTGILLFKDGNFMQVLEGPKRNVTPLLERIAQDPRHNGILTLIKAPLQRREFPEWSMAFRNLQDVDLRECPGYNEFLNVPLVDPALTKDPSRARRLLSAFRASMR